MLDVSYPLDIRRVVINILAESSIVYCYFIIILEHNTTRLRKEVREIRKRKQNKIRKIKKK
jgi:hypothetical protein